MTNNSIFNIIICKFSYGEEFDQIVLFEINKSLKMSFYNASLPFCLVVDLKIKGSQNFLHNA